MTLESSFKRVSPFAGAYPKHPKWDLGAKKNGTFEILAYQKAIDRK